MSSKIDRGDHTEGDVMNAVKQSSEREPYKSAPRGMHLEQIATKDLGSGRG